MELIHRRVIARGHGLSVLHRRRNHRVLGGQGRQTRPAEPDQGGGHGNIGGGGVLGHAGIRTQLHHPPAVGNGTGPVAEMTVGEPGVG